MSAETVRTILESRLDSPVEVGTYRGVEGVWAKVDLDPRVDTAMRPTSLALTGLVVDEMKVRFVATTADREAVMETLSALDALTDADGEVSATNHDLSASEEVWPHIQYEDIPLSAAVSVLETLEGEPLPTYPDG